MAKLPDVFIIKKTSEGRAEVTYEITKPISNADKIRSMSDEEMAEWIVATFPDNYCVPYSKGFKEDCDGVNCNICNCWVEWLKQEVDE